jgi:hypothetical protein
VAVVSGYRLVLRDLPPHALWRGVRERVDYSGYSTHCGGDEVVTPPNTHVEDAGGMRVSRNLYRMASISVWHP